MSVHKPYYMKATKKQLQLFVSQLHNVLDGDNQWRKIPSFLELWDRTVEMLQYQDKFFSTSRQLEKLTDEVATLLSEAGIPYQRGQNGGYISRDERMVMLAEKTKTISELQGIIVDMVREQRSTKGAK